MTAAADLVDAASLALIAACLAATLALASALASNLASALASNLGSDQHDANAALATHDWLLRLSIPQADPEAHLRRRAHRVAARVPRVHEDHRSLARRRVVQRLAAHGARLGTELVRLDD